VLRPLNYMCSVSGLVPYNYVPDRRTKRANLNSGYLNDIFTVIWLILYNAGFSVQILDAYSFDMASKNIFCLRFIYYIY